MTRLPIPGSDDGTWGDILNDFLSVEHNPDGTLKASGTFDFVPLTEDREATPADVGKVLTFDGAEARTLTLPDPRTFQNGDIIAAFHTYWENSIPLTVTSTVSNIINAGNGATSPQTVLVPIYTLVRFIAYIFDANDPEGAQWNLDVADRGNILRWDAGLEFPSIVQDEGGIYLGDGSTDPTQEWKVRLGTDGVVDAVSFTGGGATPLTAKAYFNESVTPGGKQLGWIDHSGPSPLTDLFDLTEPTSPVALAAGMYAVSGYVSVNGADIQAGKVLQGELDLDQNHVDPYTLGTAAMVSASLGACVPLAATAHVPVGGTCSVYADHDGTGGKQVTGYIAIVFTPDA